MFNFYGLISKASRFQNARFIHNKKFDCFQISEEVLSSLTAGKPVVALESTIMTHGMPYPENLRTALKVEDVIRKNKAVPATIGVINGKVTIGMTQDQLQLLASKNKQFVKISRRDLPYVLSKGMSGGTTVAATMALSYRAGISIFVTGGIGGVHRGAETSMDISADLFELARTPMTVISAGVKSILDIGRTLEYLETYGVCVATYGSSKKFPAFFIPHSEFSSTCNVPNVQEAAKLIDSRDRLRLESGLLIAVPIPEAQSTDGSETEKIIEQALAEAKSSGVSGKEVTPFVLSRVQELSQGASLRANIALIENNAHIGSLIAVELANIKKQLRSQNDDNPQDSRKNSSTAGSCVTEKTSPDFAPKTGSRNSGVLQAQRPVVIGGTILDLYITALDDVKMNGSTYSGQVQSTAGGVGRNVADCLSRLGSNPLFLSVLGAQEYAETLLTKMNHMDTSGFAVLEDARSATCAVILDRHRECMLLVGDMAIFDKLSVQQIQIHESAILKAPIVVIDANIPLETMKYIFDLCSYHKIPVWFEPTDFNKAGQPFECDNWRGAIIYASPNLNELRVMHRVLTRENSDSAASENLTRRTVEDTVEECLLLSKPLVEEMSALIVTLGANGTLIVTTQTENEPFLKGRIGKVIEKGPVRAIHYSAPVPEKIVSVSGAGDCFAAGMLSAMLAGRDLDASVLAGQNAALMSLASYHTVPDTISKETVLRDLTDNSIFSRRKQFK